MRDVEPLLNAVLACFEADLIAEALSTLESGLNRVRQGVSAAEWSDVCKYCVTHAISDYVYQDPFTKWAYDKPRGYPGDAILMDYTYGWPAIDQEVANASTVGQSIYRFSRSTAAVSAAKFRLNFLATLIDELAGKVTAGPEILSIASGHVREAHVATSVKAGRIRRFVALDQDEITTGVVDEELGGYGVETVTEAVRGIVMGKRDLGRFDLVYSVGLSDYLPSKIVERLIGRMFSMLNPGGQLLVPNFLPDIPDSGFMESFMDWHLIYRTADEMLALSQILPEDDVVAKKTFADPSNNIIFLQIMKRSH